MSEYLFEGHGQFVKDLYSSKFEDNFNQSPSKGILSKHTYLINAETPQMPDQR